MTGVKKLRLSLWAKAALIRALRTFAQAAIAALPTTAYMMGEVNWMAVASMACGAAVLSLLTSVATGLPEVDQVVPPELDLAVMPEDGYQGEEIADDDSQ